MLRDEDWGRIDELFDAALDLPDAARARWLDAVCEREPELRARVERLLELAKSEDDRLRPNPAAADLVRALANHLQSS